MILPILRRYITKVRMTDRCEGGGGREKEALENNRLKWQKPK
jgi:hypothetical protein